MTLFPLTQQILDTFCLTDKRVDAHDPQNLDDSDVIFLETKDTDAFTDGEVICVQRFEDGQYLVSLESAHRFGGWATHWTSPVVDDTHAMEILKPLLSRHPLFK